MVSSHKGVEKVKNRCIVTFWLCLKTLRWKSWNTYWWITVVPAWMLRNWEWLELVNYYWKLWLLDNTSTFLDKLLSAFILLLNQWLWSSRKYFESRWSNFYTSVKTKSMCFQSQPWGGREHRIPVLNSSCRSVQPVILGFSNKSI